MTRTRVLTLVLVLLVGGVVGYWIWPWAGPTTGLSGAAGAGGGRGAKTGKQTDVTDIRLELLRRERGELSAPDRNPFRFERRASAAPPPRPRPVAPDSAHRGGADRTAAASAATTDPPPVHRVPAAERCVGPRSSTERHPRQRVQREGRRRDRRSLPFAAVGDNSADLIYLDGRGRQTIRLSGQ
jgi:hypothetical protein